MKKFKLKKFQNLFCLILTCLLQKHTNTIQIQPHFYGFTNVELQVVSQIQNVLQEKTKGKIWSEFERPSHIQLKKLQAEEPEKYDILEFTVISDYCLTQKAFEANEQEIEKNLKKIKNIPLYGLKEEKRTELLKKVLTVKRFKETRGSLLDNPSIFHE